MLNHIVIMGRMTRDPETRQTPNGNTVVTFTLACERDYQQGGGEKHTDFVNCVAWRQTGEFVNSYFRKGNLILVQGSLQSRKWEDKDGKKRTDWEVVVSRAHFTGEKTGQAGHETPEAPTFTEDATSDGELPF